MLEPEVAVEEPVPSFVEEAVLVPDEVEMVEPLPLLLLPSAELVEVESLELEVGVASSLEELPPPNKLPNRPPFLVVASADEVVLETEFELKPEVEPDMDLDGAGVGEESAVDASAVAEAEDEEATFGKRPCTSPVGVDVDEVRAEDRVGDGVKPKKSGWLDWLCLLVDGESSSSLLLL